MQAKTILRAALMSLVATFAFSPYALAGPFGGEGDYDPSSPLGRETVSKKSGEMNPYSDEYGVYSPFEGETLSEKPYDENLMEDHSLKLPDLEITYVTVGNWHAEVMITNTGDAYAAPNLLAWEESTHSPARRSPTYENVWIPGLFPGQSYLVRVPLTPNGRPDCYDGRFIIDAADTVPEWSERNNSYSIYDSRGCV